MSDKTPLMTQYRDIKSQYSDCILFFRVGDFYETFFDDAVEISSILNIALTTRDKQKPNPIPLAGVPFHAAETYITRLLASGKKVAVCEQVEDVSAAKGLVRREVVEVLTPGTSMSTQLLADPSNNYCLALFFEGDVVGLALVDVSTGEFMCGEGDINSVHHLVQGKRVREVLIPEPMDRALITDLVEAIGNPHVTALPADTFGSDSANAALDRQFSGDSAVTQGLAPNERLAAGALLAHCFSLRDEVLPQVVEIERLGNLAFLCLDDETIGNLELFEPLRGGKSDATLVKTLDKTRTPMGGRELRRWIERPLRHVRSIDERLSAVEFIYHDVGRHETTLRALSGISDVQRLASRLAARKAIPREFHALRDSLAMIPEIRSALADTGCAFFETALAELDDHATLCDTIERGVVENPPGHLRDGGVIRKGFDAELDKLIEESEKAKAWLTALEARERERTGIGTLRVGYNRVFGYYLEVSKANASLVPPDYIAKQTLVSSQRYYTEEIKSKEDLILGTEERRVELENKVFDRLCDTVAESFASIQRTASAIGRIDTIQSLAAVARLGGYHRPVIEDSLVLEVTGGRHPVLERFTTEAFVPNDISLDPERRQFGLITGPNMSGKSTFLRQTALIVLMAQMGSFVPAESARIGLVDQIFTRVGAADRLSRGESTFLVEMNETAHILERMTNHSLVLLDEVGRGTSTYDGLSIAWAVTEYLLEGTRARPRSLFATHFHELTQLRSTYPRMINLKISIREWEGGVVFLRKIVPGTSDRSFGIHAARVAGLPPSVITRAQEILQSLEVRRDLLSKGGDLEGPRDQYTLFNSSAQHAAPEQEDELLTELRNFDLDRSTPLDAMQFLQSIKDRLGEKT